jgi:hypothetical protein
LRKKGLVDWEEGKPRTLHLLRKEKATHLTIGGFWFFYLNRFLNNLLVALPAARRAIRFPYRSFFRRVDIP